MPLIMAGHRNEAARALECRAKHRLFGDRFGDPASLERADGMYVWVVEDRSPADLTAVRGAKKGKSATRYRLTLRTNPDHTFIDFVPGIGITHYTYGHHGTPAYTDLRLVEFGKK